MKKAIIVLPMLAASNYLNASQWQLQRSEQKNDEALYFQQLEHGDASAANRLYALADLNRPNEAVWWVQTLKKLAIQTVNKPIQFKALRELGYAYHSGISAPKNWSIAQGYYKKLLKHFPYVSIDAQVGFSSQQIEQSKLAIISVFLNLSEIYHCGGYGIARDLEKAQFYFLKILKLGDATQKVVAIYKLGNIAATQNKHTQAILKLEEVEQQTTVPQLSSRASFILGNIYKSKDDLPRAVAKYQKAAAGGARDDEARSLSAKELVFLLWQGGFGLEKNVPAAQHYALQLLRETTDSAVASGMRAFLRYTGYKAGSILSQASNEEEKKAKDLATQIFAVPAAATARVGKRDFTKTIE